MRFLYGMLAGILITLLVLGAAYLYRRLRCRHDEIEAHTIRHYISSKAIVAICLTCGKTLEFNIGAVADTESAALRASNAVLNAKGYEYFPHDDKWRKPSVPQERSGWLRRSITSSINN